MLVFALCRLHCGCRIIVGLEEVILGVESPVRSSCRSLEEGWHVSSVKCWGGRGRDGCERLSQAQLAATQNYPFPASLCWQRADFTWVLNLHLDSNPGEDYSVSSPPPFLCAPPISLCARETGSLLACLPSWFWAGLCLIYLYRPYWAQLSALYFCLNCPLWGASLKVQRRGQGLKG